MQIYESDSIPGHLIVPHLVARTNEIVRAVVLVEKRADVVVSLNLPPETEPGTELPVQEFLNAIREPGTREVFGKLIDFAARRPCSAASLRNLIRRSAVFINGKEGRINRSFPLLF
jgi:hypothetical protein